MSRIATRLFSQGDHRIEAERGEVTALEKEVIDSLRTHELVASHVDEEFQSTRTLGEQLADHIARA